MRSDRGRMKTATPPETKPNVPPRERTYAGEAIDGRFDTGALAGAEAVLRGESHGKGRLRHLLPFFGPAFIAAIAYVDPGNFATNIEGGAKFGYLLVWVIVAANFMAMLVQSLSAKLGIATGKNLAELIGSNYPKPVVYAFWGIAELVAIATDLAEILGAAVGFYLVFHIPLLPAAFLTGIATFLVLGLQSYGFRPVEAVISVFIGIIAVCYVLEMFLVRPDWGEVASAFVPPRFEGPESVVLAAGILGATVMPHVIYLHSALTQDRVIAANEDQRKRLFRFEVADIAVAMGLAGFVNIAMLLMAAGTFHGTGLISEGDDLILRAYETLTPILGNGASTIFGISLIAAGLSSSAVGTMSGQVIMRGFLGWQIPILLRRGITMVPAFIVIALGIDATRTLIISQVVLSFGIPFALIPLVIFTSRRSVMGNLVNHRATTIAASIVATIIIALNAFLLHQLFL